jgi:CBS domain-containing protein
MVSVLDILRTKGPAVETIRPDETAKAFAEHIKDERIGAMIVSHDGSTMDGIISERDLAYGLATFADKLPIVSVSELMTKRVIFCRPEDSIAEVMKVMTQRRIRHLPVKNGEQLIGIISIGDVLIHRLVEIQLEADVLRDVAIARR